MTASARRLARRCRERYAEQGTEPTLQAQPQQQQMTSTQRPTPQPKPKLA
jgi:hypothetical protein